MSRLMAKDNCVMDELYDALARLLAQPDALDPDSDTARRMAEIEQMLEPLEQEEADELQAAFEASSRIRDKMAVTEVAWFAAARPSGRSPITWPGAVPGSVLHLARLHRQTATHSAPDRVECP